VTNYDEAKRLRVRDEAIADNLSVLPFIMDAGSPCMIAQTTKLSIYPSTAQQFFACQPVAVLGTETEGSQAIFTTHASTFLALNLGGTVPPQGTNVIASFTGNRWVFRYDA
jgi:hypothetical protein